MVYCDQARKGNIDWGGMKKQARESARQRWEAYQRELKKGSIDTRLRGGARVVTCLTFERGAIGLPDSTPIAATVSFSTRPNSGDYYSV